MGLPAPAQTSESTSDVEEALEYSSVCVVDGAGKIIREQSDCERA